MLSSCLDAWLKYRPSVAKAAFSRVTTAVPAEPVNPQMNSDRVNPLAVKSCRYTNKPRRASHAAMYSDWWLSSDGTTGRYCKKPLAACILEPPTVDIYSVLLHQVSKLPQSFRGVYSLHLGLEALASGKKSSWGGLHIMELKARGEFRTE